MCSSDLEFNHVHISTNSRNSSAESAFNFSGRSRINLPTAPDCDHVRQEEEGGRSVEPFMNASQSGRDQRNRRTAWIRVAEGMRLIRTAVPLFGASIHCVALMAIPT